jgi:hypothetical protein
MRRRLIISLLVFPQLWLVVVAGAGAMSFSSPLVQVVTAQEASDIKPKVNQQISPEVRVIVLDPWVQFEDVRSDSIIPSSATQDEIFRSRLLAAATGEVEARKLSMVKPESFSDLHVADDCARLRSVSSRLARGIVNEEAREILKRLADVNDGYAILVQFMRVKVGPGGSWNPYSGAITSSISSTLLQAALVASKTGQVIWKNEVFVRKTFRPDSPEFTKKLGLLYQTLAAK